MTIKVASGGASGAYVEKFFTGLTGGSTLSYTVGAGGTGGAASDGDGVAGGDSTFVVGGTTVTAKGGAGGNTRTSVLGTAIGASGGTSTNGDVNGSGIPGSTAILFDHTVEGIGISGSGGTPLGGADGVGGLPVDHAVKGQAGVGHAAGGGGAYSYIVTDRAGGAGTGGMWIVEEYT